jgi:hypothetical protein
MYDTYIHNIHNGGGGGGGERERERGMCRSVSRRDERSRQIPVHIEKAVYASGKFLRADRPISSL